MTPITGGCLCGAVRYTASAAPIVTRQCWCRTCQYLGAGSSTVNLMFRTENVRFTGDLRLFGSTADSGNRLQRGFCPACGTPVTTMAEARPHVMGIRAGTLDEPKVFSPELNIWTKSAPRWAQLDANLPWTPGQPPPAA